MINYREKLHQITTFIFDFDGVLSDGKIYTFPDGDMIRTTNVKDGYAIHYAQKLGYRMAIISGGYSETMLKRFSNFPEMEIYMRVNDKVKVFEEYLDKHQITCDEVLYMGDDIPDLQLMQMAGVTCCPEDAAEEIKAVADYISHKQGGAGCVRDVIEQTLKAQGKWMGKDAHIW